MTGVKIGSTTYEPTDGVVDLSSPMGNKVDKNGTDSLMTAAEHTKLSGIAAGAQVNVINSISVNNTPATPVNGNVNISVSAGEDGQDGADGKSAYQSYLDTTSDNPKKTETEWVASLRGRDGVESGDDVVVVNDFGGTPSSIEQGKVAVLGADMGASIKAVMDRCYRSSSVGESSTVIIEEEVEHSLTAGTSEGQLGASIVVGQRKPGLTGGIEALNTQSWSLGRACINGYFSRNEGEGLGLPFPDVFTVQLPTGYQVSVVGSDTKTTSESAVVWDTGWLDNGTEVDLTDVGAVADEPGNKTYYVINFKRSAGENMSNEDIAALISGFAIKWITTEEVEQEVVGPSAGKAMEFIGANGQVAKTVYCKEDNGNNVQVYTKEAVDSLVGQSPTGIIARNQEAIHRIWAARKHFDMNHQGSYTVYNHENNFCIAHGSDFHVDVDRLENFRDFVDGVESIDAAIITGDFTSNGTDTEFSAMMGVEFDRIEPLRCIGNHDRDGGKTLAQIATALDMDSDYYVNDDYVADYGIRIIALNRYDVASTTKSVAQRDGHFSQTQIDWFIGKLKESITNGYHVIVAMHAIDNIYGASSIRTAQNDKGFWQRWWQNEGTSTTQTSGTIIEDIIAAFRSGGSVSGNYTHNDGTTSVTVNDSFSGNGKFICYLVGHCHIDMIGYSRHHADQLYLAAPTGGCIGLDQSSNEYAVGTQVLDLPRVEGTKTEDCFNVYAVDTINKVVKVVRIGADMNDLMEKREVACFEYEPTINS